MLRLLAAAGIAAAAIFTPPAAAAAHGGCAAEQIPVTVPGLGSGELTGRLCLPAGRPPAAVQVLVPGATYDQAYWAFPSPGYSYQAYAASHGQATLAISRFNTGGSSRFVSALVTVQADAAALHQVIGALAAGHLGTRFTHVITAGHSLGSIIVTDEAARWHDTAAVALTGFTHSLDPAFAVALAAGQVLVPAQTDPQLAGQPIGDLTTPPGARATWFYAPSASRTVIAKDEAARSVITAGELATFPVPMTLPETREITTPVFQAVGAQDRVFWCGPAPCSTPSRLRAAESTWFTSSPAWTPWVGPGDGHDLSLAAGRRLFFAAMSEWAAHVTP